jgi:phenylacetate-CoA ligase
VSEPGLAWLERQPILGRDELVPIMDALRAQGGRAGLAWRSTSGSTGAPFRFARDVQMEARMDSAMWAAYAWHGVKPGDAQARFWGMPRNPVRRLVRRTKDLLLNRDRLDAFRVTPERCRRFFASVQRLRATHGYGYPTLTRLFADSCHALELDGRSLGLRVFISTGELLTEETRRVIGSFFGCPVVNEYGCTESGVLAIECEHGTMHAIPVAAFAEVLSPDARSAAEGEVVVTDLYGRAGRFVRYRLGDRGVLTDGACPCGRELWGLVPQSGRIDAFIQTPSKGPVYDAILAYTVPPSVQRFRGFQVAPDRLVIEVVGVGGQVDEVTLNGWREALLSALGRDMTISFAPRTDLTHELSGKLRYFVPLEAQGKSQPAADAGR